MNYFLGKMMDRRALREKMKLSDQERLSIIEDKLIENSESLELLHMKIDAMFEAAGVTIPPHLQSRGQENNGD